MREMAIVLAVGVGPSSDRKCFANSKNQPEFPQIVPILLSRYSLGGIVLWNLMRGHFSFNLSDRTLPAQIENPAHHLDNKWRLIGCSSVQQHCHWRLEHLFYDATTKRFHKVFLVRAQIAQASP